MSEIFPQVTCQVDATLTSRVTVRIGVGLRLLFHDELGEDFGESLL